MKRILCFIMIFAIISSFAVCFAGVESVEISVSEDTNKTPTGMTVSTGSTIFSWNDLFSRYKGVIVGISGVAALTFLVFFIINFMKLGQSSGNPQMRSQALMGIVWCGIACAGLGGIAIFFGFFYNVLKN